MNGLLIAAFVVLFAIAGWFAWQAEKKRRAAFQVWADAHGFRYRHEHDASLRETYGFLNRLQVGHSRRGDHVLQGEWEGRRAAAFQFKYTVGAGKNQQTYHVGVALLHLERSFPELLIGPESVVTRFANTFGFGDIDFESVAFSRAFNVRCKDKKFAYDFCNSGMMEYLLARQHLCLEQEGGVLAVMRDGALQAKHLDDLFGTLAELRARMPDYLFRS